MRICLGLISALLIGTLAPAFAQDTMRAIIKGDPGRDRGKCTIEVNVDDAAEVEIRGDMGRIRTLGGQPAQWRRFECSSVMPRNPAQFRFVGVDGRGQVSLVRDPRQTGGVAVVRIYDPKNGREGYTFDLEWQGGFGGGYGPSGNGDLRDRDRDRDWDRGDRDRDGDGRYSDRDRDYGRDGDRDRDSFIVTCSSDDGGRHYCRVDNPRGVRLVKQISGSPCRRGDSWGVDDRGIWVDHGCRADFRVRR